MLKYKILVVNLSFVFFADVFESFFESVPLVYQSIISKKFYNNKLRNR